jgi:hypothetical protein
MRMFERVVYRDGGKVKTATLVNPVESAYTLSGGKVDGQGRDLQSHRNGTELTIRLSRVVISRTRMQLNEQGTALEPMKGAQAAEPGQKLS